MTFGERIRQLRRERGLTQRQLAVKVGVDFTYLSKIENNRLSYTPSLRTIRELAACLQADELELLELAKKVPPSLERFTKSRAGREFLRRATEVVRRPEEWKDLLRYLEEKGKG